MSEVAHRAFAPVPSESNFEGLTKRLLALRAEIDAILSALASQPMAMPQGAAVMMTEAAPALSPPAEEPAAAAKQDMLEVPSDPKADAESKLESCVTLEETEVALEPTVDETGTDQILEPSEMAIAAAVAERPVADAIALEPIAVEQDARDWAESACDHSTPTAVIDTDAADHTGDADLSAEAEIAPAEMLATEAVTAEHQDDAAMLDAPQLSAPEAIRSEEHLPKPVAQVDSALPAVDGPQAAPSPIMPASEADEALADAAVISLHARQRKHKGALTNGAPMPVRANRHLAAKVAAGILVLLTAATLLVMADRTAFGSVPSLPWMTQTPSVPTGIDWLLQRIKDGAAQLSRNAAAIGDAPPLNDGPFAGSAWGA